MMVLCMALGSVQNRTLRTVSGPDQCPLTIPCRSQSSVCRDSSVKSAHWTLEEGLTQTQFVTDIFYHQGGVTFPLFFFIWKHCEWRILWVCPLTSFLPNHPCMRLRHILLEAGGKFHTTLTVTGIEPTWFAAKLGSTITKPSSTVS